MGRQEACPPAVRREGGTVEHMYPAALEAAAKRTVFLFDLDGTLTDPAEGITKSVQYALRAFGIEAEDPEALCTFIGPPLAESFQRYFGFSPEQAGEAIGKFREYFSEKGLYENRLYPGITEMLAELKKAGAILMVATSKPEKFAEQILSHFRLRKYFDCVAGADMEEKRVKKGEVIRYGLDKLSACLGRRVSAGECLMIGDREHDVLGAREAGMDCAGVRYGYAGPGELEQAGAVYIAESPGELQEFLLLAMAAASQGKGGENKGRAAGYKTEKGEM